MNELATTERNFTADQVALIKSMIAVGCTDDELQLFLYTAKKTGLDPLARQIYAIKRGGKMTIQTGIDGYRVIADRTGKLAGITDYLYGHDDPAQKYPTTASVTVRKLVTDTMVAEFTATARWGEYNAGGPMWQKMPYLMLGKCAEALALRKAFPADLSGVYTAEEMAQADNPERDAVYQEVDRQKTAHQQAAYWDKDMQRISEPVEGRNPNMTNVNSERQKSNIGQIGEDRRVRDANFMPRPEELPPELDFEYVPASGLLICRLVAVNLKAKADGTKYLTLQTNQKIGGKYDLMYYWHATHRDALLFSGVGKVVKMMVTEKPKGITVDLVLEIDGKKVSPITVEETVAQKSAPRKVTDVELSTELKAESDARLLGSYLEFSEEELREAFSTVGKGNWTKTFQLLKEEKARREA